MRIIEAEALKHIVNSSKYYGSQCQRDFCDMITEAPTIKTKQIKYYDEDENVWKIGEVIVDE